MFQLAFICLCLALILHLSVHWYALHMRLRAEARLKKAVDWNNVKTTRERRSEKKPLLKRLGLVL